MDPISGLSPTAAVPVSQSGVTLNRRQFLHLGAGVAGAAALASCGGTSSSGSGATPSAPGAAGTVVGTGTTAGTALGAGRLTDIDHVVIFMKENRSFDHYFGARPGVRGFADPAVLTGTDGKPIWYQPAPSHPDGYVLPFHYDTTTTKAQCALDPDHSWASQHAAWNGGKMDGFASTMGPISMGYFERADLPYYWALADEFTLCDQSFCSVLGPTSPNRRYAMSGTIDPAGAAGGPATDNRKGPFSWETYPERLQRAGVSWRIYHEVDDDDGDNVVVDHANYQGLATGNPLYDNAVAARSATSFIEDATAGNLPQVSWIVAPAALSEHPIWPPAYGEDLTARTLAAIMGNATLWAKTAFILTYDENGGFFDHVPPPIPPPGTKDELVDGQPIGLGFRVPTMMVSPWSRGGRVNSDVVDHTSTLRFLETRFGVEVPNLSAWRRSTCGDLTSTLDLSRADTSVPSLPATAAGVDLAKQQCATLPLPSVPSPQTLPTQGA